MLDSTKGKFYGQCKDCKQFKNLKTIKSQQCPSCYKRATTKFTCLSCGEYKTKYSSDECYICYKKRMDIQVTTFTLRLDVEDHKQIKDIATHKNVSMAELVKTFITWGIENEAAN